MTGRIGSEIIPFLIFRDGRRLLEILVGTLPLEIVLGYVDRTSCGLETLLDERSEERILFRSQVGFHCRGKTLQDVLYFGTGILYRLLSSCSVPDRLAGLVDAAVDDESNVMESWRTGKEPGGIRHLFGLKVVLWLLAKFVRLGAGRSNADDCNCQRKGADNSVHGNVFVNKANIVFPTGILLYLPIMKRILFSLAALLFGLAAQAKIELSPLFTDNMVFQQNCSASVWGKATPGAKVTVTPSWNGRAYSCTAGTDGRWSVNIDTPAGSYEKYTVTISDGKPVVLQNVLVGEVWLCSGQSNMEMPVESWRAVRVNRDDIQNAADYPYLRLLYVTKTTGMSPRDSFDAENGGWTESLPKTVRGFSAVAYYYGRALQQELKVPVGVIESCWGGTIIEAWMSAEALSSYPEMAPKIAQVAKLAETETDRENTFKKEMARFVAQAKADDKGFAGGKAPWAARPYDDSSWGTMKLPEKIQTLWPSTNGVFWFRKEVEIPSSWAGRNLTLSLGPVDDYDETYFNGKLVGTGEVWNMAREYVIPGKMVKAGKSVLCIRVTDDHGDGGLYGAADQLYLEGPDGTQIRLDGEWKVKKSLDFGSRKVSTAREPNLASVLYNAMVKPLVPFAIKGAIWYQGESNAGKAYRYRDLMSAMVLDWRSAWGYDFPFYITQITGYHEVSPVPGEFSWAELREAQSIAASVLDAADVACIIDLGEAEDVHPVRKKEVGDRLALLALANDYGREVISSGPRFESYRIGHGNIRVHFTSVADGLKAVPSGSLAGARYGSHALGYDIVKRAERGEVTGFQIAGADRVWHWATADIEGDEVIVYSEDVPHPVAVRYGWADNPVCNLFNSAGLPAHPFRTDDWPGVTAGKE